MGHFSFGRITFFILIFATISVSAGRNVNAQDLCKRKYDECMEGKNHQKLNLSPEYCKAAIKRRYYCITSRNAADGDYWDLSESTTKSDSLQAEEPSGISEGVVEELIGFITEGL